MLHRILNSYLFKKEPFTLIHYITSQCNASCRHCFIDVHHPRRFEKELTLGEIEELSKHLGKSLFNVNLTGGEPFLREDIFEIARIYFQNTPIQSIFITTNGAFPARIKKFGDDFIRSGIRGRVIFSISIDGFEKEHDENRGVKGLYQKAVESYKTIEAYHSDNIIANIAITVTGHNHGRVLELYAHLKAMGIKAVVAILMREAGAVKKIENKPEILEAYLALAREIHRDQMERTTAGYGGSLQGTLMNCKNGILYKLIPPIYLDHDFLVNCVAGRLFGVIYANGDLHPCEILDHPLGNLREFNMDFMKIWQSKAAGDFRGLVKRTRCTCTFECVWSINIISNFRFVLPMLYNFWKLKWGNPK
jgi:MoaA/NifB/PqqE/SkfB family radical SAM enzyme